MLAEAIAILAGILAAAPSAESAGEFAPDWRGRVAVVAVGDCSDASLQETARALRLEVALLLPDRTIGEDETATPAGGLPHRSLTEVRRALEAGKADFFKLGSTAEQTLLSVLPDIDTLPPGPERWRAYWEVRAWLARFAQENNKQSRASALLAQILRLDETFRLGSGDFPP